MHEDARVSKTKAALREALKELLRDAPLDSVAVKQVITRAGTSKKTFYAHYHDIYDLAADTYLTVNPYYGKPYRPLRTYSDGPEAIRGLLDGIATTLEADRQTPNLTLAVTAMDTPNPLFSELNAFRVNLLADFFKDEWSETPMLQLAAEKECALYAAAGYRALVGEWLRSGATERVESIAKRLAYLNLHTAGALVGRPVPAEYIAVLNSWHWDGLPQKA